MIENKITDKYVSGYLRLNPELTILEIGGETEYLFVKNLVEDASLIDVVSDFDDRVKKKLFDCLQLAVKAKIVKNCFIFYRKNEFQLNITPLSNGEIILSFSTEKKQEFDNSGFFENSFQGIIVRFNQKAQHLFISDKINVLIKRKSQSLIGKRPTDFKYFSEYSQDFENLVLNVFRTEEPISRDVRLVQEKGAIWLQLNIVPEKDENGKVLSVVCYMNDITNRKNKELEQSDMNKRLQQIIEVSNTGVWDWFVGNEDVYFQENGNRNWVITTMKSKINFLTGKPYFTPMIVTG